MTSDINDAPTRAFFKKHDYFGYDPADVFFFQQGMMPAFSMDGQMLLAEKDSPGPQPRRARRQPPRARQERRAGRHAQRGVEHLSYFQVDNPLVHCIDPLFLGLHDLTGSEMSSKTIPKANAWKRSATSSSADGVVQVIEYSDLPEELALQTNPDGTLRFNAGSIAIHALRGVVHRAAEPGRAAEAAVAPGGEEGPVRRRRRAAR